MRHLLVPLVVLFFMFGCKQQLERAEEIQKITLGKEYDLSSLRCFAIPDSFQAGYDPDNFDTVFVDVVWNMETDTMEGFYMVIFDQNADVWNICFSDNMAEFTEMEEDMFLTNENVNDWSGIDTSTVARKKPGILKFLEEVFIGTYGCGICNTWLHYKMCCYTHWSGIQHSCEEVYC